MADIGLILLDGTTVTFAGWSGMANVTGISHSGMSRNTVDASHLGTTGAKPFLASGMYDPGEITVDMLFDVDGVISTTPNSLPEAIANKTAQTLTITFAATEVFTASSFLTGFEWTGEKENIPTATATFKLAAAPVWPPIA